jgi:2-isopropylmalate synthase
MISLYDTTLRDGAQREGVSLGVEDKLAIAVKLDELGVRWIEGGFPASNPKDAEFFARAAELRLNTASIVAFGPTRHKDVAAEEDAGLRALAVCPVNTVALVGKAWERQIVYALETSVENNLAMIADSVRYLVAAGKEVFFDAEHYYDGYREDTHYALEVLVTALEAGAGCVVLCDTNGGMLPNGAYEITRATIAALAERGWPDAVVGIHMHDDSGCGVANSLEALRAGATLVQGTVNGYGERVGNANLLTIAANLELKCDERAVGAACLSALTPTAQFVAEVFNVALDAHAPYVGRNAFAHKGGLHVSAARRVSGAYEHVDPAAVGNLAHIVVSELAGKATLEAKAGQLGIELPAGEATAELLEVIKGREAGGYSYEVADGSLALLLKAGLGEPAAYFRLESFRVIADKREDGRVATEATIKIHVGGERFVATGEGNGPVNALDTALRMAIRRFYPQIDALELSDYKVRVLDEATGTGAVTRVLIETTDGAGSWGTVGVSDNIIEASWDALVDSISYGLLRSDRRRQVEGERV